MQAHGFLAIWHDVAPGFEAAVRDWYAREHHFERLALPGFAELHRYDKVRGDGGAIFNLYRTQSVDVFASEAYQARLADPTPATRTLMPQFRNMSRTICRLAAQAGRAEGGFLGVVGLIRNGAPAQVDVRGLNRALAKHQVLRARLLHAASDMPASAGAESRLRGRPDAGIEGALLVDAESAGAAADAVTELAAEFAHPVSTLRPGVYRLAFAARAIR